MRSEFETSISGIQSGIQGLERPGNPGLERADSAGFTSALGKALNEVDGLQVEADQQAQKVAEGGGNLHELALSLEKADVAMRLAMKVRNKVFEAYNEIMRMGL
jgi:flagellar hook-basal body complex protein FliE